MSTPRASLEKVLWNLKIPVGVLEGKDAPSVTAYPIVLGNVVEREIESKLNDVAGRLGVKSVRGAYEEGTNLYSIEVAKSKRQIVRFSDIELQSKATLPVLLGIANSGRVLSADLTSLPHLLVAGSTGAGKSVFLHGVLSTLISRLPPSQLRLVLHDGKIVELAQYEDVPHLLVPILSDNQSLIDVLEALCSEMDSRYYKFKQEKALNIASYNKKSNDKLPYIVAVVDEVADVVTLNKTKAQVEPLLQRLAQKARAAGIHLILATQRPEQKILSTLLRVNIPGRVAFRVTDNPSSRAILDEGGAENLLGKGDGLFKSPDGAFLRFQSAYLTEAEIDSAVAKAKRMPRANYGLEGYQQRIDIPETLSQINRAKMLLEYVDGVSPQDLKEHGIVNSTSQAKRVIYQLRDMGLIGSYDPDQGKSPTVQK